MKLIIKLMSIALALGLYTACSNSGESFDGIANANATFKIWGNCEMCKETIEGSLKMNSVKTADWNKDTKMMTVVFDSTKISLDQIEKKVAAVGYDNEKYKGDDASYSKLPECCQYERKSSN